LPKRILFITATRLGDAVLSTGVLARMVADYPGAELTIVCGPLLGRFRRPTQCRHPASHSR
jgi:ADP-heptose:LPS heptosyltransferase